MRVYQFRHIRARRDSSPDRRRRGYRHAAGQPPVRIGVIPIVNRAFALLCAVGLCCLASACGSAGHRAASASVREPSSELIVTLASPPMAGRTGASGRAARTAIDREQARFASALHDAIPGARIRWRYRIVLNGAAVVVPNSAVGRLRTLPGVREVDAGATYTVNRLTAADIAKAAATWSTGLTNQGAGIKIGIIDDGVDQTHPYFAPAGYTMPAGFPKGQAAYTTAKVIVARAFAPAGITWKYAHRPFDPVQSGHATHVAGIAAGNAGTAATGGVRVSGIAPRAYIGNYKALSVPTDANVGLDGNAPEIVAAIEAAVSDGMDVINLSLGEPEIEPSRDIVARALDAAAVAGVVPVVAAGNDFEEFGGGSLISPGTSERAITVAAVTSPDASGGSSARRLQLRRPDTAVAAAEARRQRPRRLDPVLGARRPLGGDVRHVDGDATDRRRSGPPDRAASHAGRWPTSRLR